MKLVERKTFDPLSNIWTSIWHDDRSKNRFGQLKDIDGPISQSFDILHDRSFLVPGAGYTSTTTYAHSLTGDHFGDIGNTTAVNEPNYWAFSLLLFPFITLFGNILVVLSVLRDNSLHTATNYFIVSLAAADIALAVIVMPICSWFEVINRIWQHSAIFCDIFIMFDVMLCTASILNLVAISIDRYVAVTRPIIYSRHNNMLRVAMTIVLVWIVSFLIALPIVCGLNDSPERNSHECVMNSAGYIIGSSIGSFYVPGGIMIFLYLKVFSVIRNRARRYQFSNGDASLHSHRAINRPSSITGQAIGSTQCKGNMSMQSDTDAGSQVVTSSRELDDKERGCLTPSIDYRTSADKSVSFLCNRQHLYQTPCRLITETNGEKHNRNELKELCQIHPLASDTNNPTTVSFIDNISCNEIREHDATFETEKDCKYMGKCKEVDGKFKNMDEFRKHLRSRIRQARSKKLKITTFHDVGLTGKEVYALSPSSLNLLLREKASKRPQSNLSLSSSSCTKEKPSAKRERKATKTLAIVLGVFLICWMPFFTLNIILAICVQRRSSATPCQLYEPFLTFSVWLGYVNSTLNPIIYTIFNNDFRKAFKKLLGCLR